MRLPDGTTLMHAGQPYDPAKAHDYYLRTRKLKGRKKGAAPTTGKPVPGAKGVKPVQKKKKSDPAEITKLKAHTAARVAVLKKKLHQLQTELKKRMAEAEKSAKKKPTAADKHAKARDAKQYRDKHKQQLKTKAKKAAGSGGGSSKPKAQGQQEGIDHLKKTIDDVKTKLTAAVARQRALG